MIDGDFMLDRMERISILSVPVDRVSRRGALECIVRMLASNVQSHVATPNPEMLIAAQRDEQFRVLLQATTLNIPDGTGLLWAARFCGHPLIERVTGTDLLQDLCRLKNGPPIFLLGAASGIAQAAAEMLRLHHPAVRIVGTFAGSPKPDDEENIIALINECKPALLFVAYGAPAQEKWIARNLRRLPTVRVAMGVGGALDFIAGRRKRSPRILQKIGLEWAWRLFQEPGRIGRIVTAVIIFPMMVLMKSNR